MRKGQVSIEAVVIIAVILMFTVIFANMAFKMTDSTKAIVKIKLKTIDLITLSDSEAILTKIDSSTSNTDLNLTLYFKNKGTLVLSDQNYTDTIENIKSTTNYTSVNLIFR